MVMLLFSSAVLVYWLAIINTTTVVASGIPLTQCCDPGESYSIGFDQCKPPESESGGINQLPAVFSVSPNQPIDVPPERFHLTHNLSACPDKHVANSSTLFRFFEDGSLLVTDHKRFSSGEFCINQIFSDENGPSVFAARFCVPDPCADKPCVKKCCPMGMSVNATTSNCQASSVEFELTLRNENGTEFDDSTRPIIVRHGLAPQCPGDMTPFFPEENEEDNFFILSDGRMMVPGWPEEERHITEYCVDNMMQDNDHFVSANQ